MSGDFCLHNDNNAAICSDDENPSSFELISAEEIASVDIEALKYHITVEEAKLAKMKPNMSAIDEYRNKVSFQLCDRFLVDRIHLLLLLFQDLCLCTCEFVFL